MSYNIPNRVPLPTFRPQQNTGMMGAFPPAPAAPAPAMMQAQAQPAQGGGIRNWLGNNSEALAAMSQGLLSGRTGSEQFAQGFGGFVGAKAAGKKRTKTMEFLEQQDPLTAQAVGLGLIDGPTAFKAIYEARNKPTEYQQRAQAWVQYGGDPNSPEGRAYVLAGKLGEDSKVDRYGLPNSGAIAQKIRALEAQGMSPDIALGVASGRYNVSINPQTGERVIVDIASQKIIPLEHGGQQPGAPAAVAAPAPEAQPTLYEMADDATGVGPTIKRGMSDTIGQIPGPVGRAGTFPDEVKAGASFDLFKRDLIRSLSLNPRFPVAEQQRIEGLVPRGPATSSGTLKSSLEELDRELARIERQATEGANNPNLHIEQRSLDRQTLQAVRAARERLGVPQGGGLPTQGGNADDPLGLR